DNTSMNMYIDLIDELKSNGHQVTAIAPSNNNQTYIGEERGVRVLRVKARETLNVKSMVKKGIALALLPYYFKKGYHKHLKGEKFDWIFMTTPPITLIDFVENLKRRTGAKLYLILRDIHPQSAASIGLIKNRLMYNYLERRARRGYKASDLIGCMSQGNIEFIANRYPKLDRGKLVLLMNWQKESGYSLPKSDVREKMGLKDKILVLFGGNIGLGQRVENLYNMAKHYSSNNQLQFLVIGKGVKKEYLQELVKDSNLTNIEFIDFMPREEYLDFIKSVDIGLISINENYKVPTCPSKAVSYMSLKIPIFAMINPGSDYGQIIEDAGAGYWVVGSDKERAYKLFDKMIDDSALRKEMGEKGYQFYTKNLTSTKAYLNIMEQIEKQ
ncbi:MAG: glycosyltransferase family 4 protein, partial [Bacteroidales bacterium]